MNPIHEKDLTILEEVTKEECEERIKNLEIIKNSKMDSFMKHASITRLQIENEAILKFVERIKLKCLN